MRLLFLIVLIIVKILIVDYRLGWRKIIGHWLGFNTGRSAGGFCEKFATEFEKSAQKLQGFL